MVGLVRGGEYHVTGTQEIKEINLKGCASAIGLEKVSSPRVEMREMRALPVLLSGTFRIDPVLAWLSLDLGGSEVWSWRE